MNTTRDFTLSRTRIFTGAICLLLCVVIWIPSGDVVDMIIRQKEIVFGRYSRGHFGGLFFLSLLLLGISALCFSSLKTWGEMVGVGLMVLISTVASGFVLVVGSGWAVKPRYVETVVEGDRGESHIAGLVRHRPPRELYHLEQSDFPEQKRSYPDAPPGYPAFNLTLTTDQYGFRNEEINGSLRESYPIVAVGDSFVAGSHVSDDQTWVSLLAKSLDTDIYNLGVSGSDPGTYYNNFVLLGRKFKPRQVLFMLYEGNDFKKITPLATEAWKNKNASPKHEKKSWKVSFENLTEASPVTKGLRRLSSEVLEVVGSRRPVPDYQQKVGFMPLKLRGNGFVHSYAFEPKRLVYLYEEKAEFRNSGSWQKIVRMMDQLVEQGKEEGYEMIFLYAPSTPHVVMPLMKDEIPALQLRNFAAYEEENLPDAETFKENVFARMGNEQEVFLEHCTLHQYACLALTDALQQATAAGQQVYYSYDQHWTPEGNRVVAGAIENYLRTR